MSTLPRKPVSRRDRDVRLGYVGVGIGAVAFLALTATNYINPGEVLPRIPVVAEGSVQVGDPPQSIRAGVLLVGVPRETAPEAPVNPNGRSVAPSGGGGAPTAPSGAEPDGPPTDGNPTDPGTGPDPGPGPEPEPGPGGPEQPAEQGPASGLVDPVVGVLTQSVDALTGGATSPATGPVTTATDEGTDIVDRLLGGLLGSHDPP